MSGEFQSLHDNRKLQKIDLEKYNKNIGERRYTGRKI